MSKLIFFFGVFLAGCVHPLQTPNLPQAIVTKDEARMRSQCRLLGDFEEVGETTAQARTILSMHAREMGATHLVLDSDRAINTKKTFNETLRNETAFSPLYRGAVASGRGYRCSRPE